VFGHGKNRGRVIPTGVGRDYGISLVKKNELVKFADLYLGYDSLYVWNANINGIIIQLRTNEQHFYDFWKENWFPAAADHNVSPHAVIYAVKGIADTAPYVYYNPESKTGILFNVDSYSEVRSMAMGILMDISEGRKNTHFLRGSLIDVNGEAVVITGPPGSGKYTHTFLLLELERARIHSDELIYVENLGGEKGRMSTHVSERMFYIKKDVEKISTRLKDLFKKCRTDGEYVLLNPWWIGGDEKYVDTTRIKAMFILNPDSSRRELVKRLSPDEAIALMQNGEPAFYNPHRMIVDAGRDELQSEFFRELFRFVSCYSVNTSKPLFEVQKRLREVMVNREYTKPYTEKETTADKPMDLESLINIKELRTFVESMYNMPNVKHPSVEEIRKAAEQYGTKTKFGNYNFVSTVKNRSAGLTVYVGSPRVSMEKLNPRQKEILKNLPKTMAEVREYINKAPFVCTERTMGDNPYFNPYCTLFVSTHRKEMVRLAHMINQTLFDPDKNAKGPGEYVVYIPEWQEKDRQILVFPEAGLTFVLGSDYYGEAKKGFLRLAMWHAKEQGMLGLHAGAKIVKAQDADTKKIKRYSKQVL